jgi:hypothetical protein
MRPEHGLLALAALSLLLMTRASRFGARVFGAVLILSLVLLFLYCWHENAALR